MFIEGIIVVTVTFAPLTARPPASRTVMVKDVLTPPWAGQEPVLRPIVYVPVVRCWPQPVPGPAFATGELPHPASPRTMTAAQGPSAACQRRSEERRVGKECR